MMKKAPVEKPTIKNYGLETPIQFCPGVGPMRAQMLRRLNIDTVRDLFWHLPRGYEDYHNVVPISHLRPGQVATVMGDIVSISERKPRYSNKVRSIIQAVVEDRTVPLVVVWFNQTYIVSQLQDKSRLLLHGKVELYDGHLQMSAPKFQVIDKEDGSYQGIAPVYPLTEGLSQNILRTIMEKALEKFEKDCVEFLPRDILEQNQYPERFTAFKTLHFPEPKDRPPVDTLDTQPDLIDAMEDETDAPLTSGDPKSLWEKARKRLVFEEFFLHQFILRRYSGHIKKQKGIQHPKPKPDPWSQVKIEVTEVSAKAWPALFIQSLPFELTTDQVKVCREIEQDMFSDAPMNRLLQGDVGSGKTIVSIYAMLVAVAGGTQAALMVPTELLAQQHYHSLCKFTRACRGLKIVKLLGSNKTKERREALQLIAAGEAHLVVGTHALFQEQVEFANLGLVVVDEQHKFGVDQRQRLVEKGNHPDLLVATATPIPRTLSLTLFGDMDVSVIASLPPNRPPVITRWTTWEKEAKVWEFMDGLVAEKQQAYVVCPIIEPSENAPHLPSTEEAFERLSETFLPKRRVALLHGRHSAQIKEELMNKMHAGEIDVIVATTVIEVGVDLPNATMMVILGAERYGLAQLHQLRGRVGRGHLKSYCVLVTPKNIGHYARERMKVMERTRDGFLIAEEDLRLRGPGEQFGIRQSGHTNFTLADPIHDIHLLHEAHKYAGALYNKDPDLLQPQHQLLKQEIIQTYHRFQFRRPS